MARTVLPKSWRLNTRERVTFDRNFHCRGVFGGDGNRAKTEVRHHKSRYEVAIATPKGVAKVKVDLSNGKVADTDEPGLFDRLFGWDGKDIAKAVATLPVSLLSVVLDLSGC